MTTRLQCLSRHACRCRGSIWLRCLVLASWWIVYVWYADTGNRQPALRRQTDHFMRDWIARMVERDNRMLDVNVMRNLTRSSQFFASTTMLILGALVALMGYTRRPPACSPNCRSPSRCRSASGN